LETVVTRPYAQTHSLTPEQRRQFMEDGVTRVCAAIPADAVDAMAERIWRVFTRRFGFLRGQPNTWTTPSAVAVIQPVLVQMANAGVFAGMLSPAVESLLDEVFGNRGWRRSPLPPRPLGPLFPTPERTSSVPTRRWHFDHVPNRPDDAADQPWPERVRLFGYLSSVEPGGGGTFYVSGSHRAAALVAAQMWATRERLTSSMLVRRLKDESDWFADLCSKGEEDPGRVSRFMGEGATFRDIPLRVAEMTGEPGDVVMWHPNLIHAGPTSNRRQTPRLMLSTTVDAGGDAES
jgi:phytanoyl-CoA dioxygenase PhyH